RRPRPRSRTPARDGPRGSPAHRRRGRGGARSAAAGARPGCRGGRCRGRPPPLQWRERRPAWARPPPHAPGASRRTGAACPPRWRALEAWRCRRASGGCGAVALAGVRTRIPNTGRSARAMLCGMSRPFPQEAYAARIAFMVELAEHLHAYGTTGPRLEASLEMVAQKLELECEPWTNPTGMVLSFSDPMRPPGDSDTTRVIRMSPGDHDLGRLCDVDR